MNILHLSIPPLPRFAATARRTFTRFAGEHQLAGRDAENLTFALGEAIANAIAHSQTTDSIEIFIQVAGDSIVATVSDRGRGFATPPAGLVPLPGLLSEAGRGFAIMQRCTDFFEVNTAPGSGTIVTLARYRRDDQELAPVS
jgi:anti-sigma regulatory factor (Ser/Thr protein kinase)